MPILYKITVQEMSNPHTSDSGMFYTNSYEDACIEALDHFAAQLHTTPKYLEIIEATEVPNNPNP